MKTFIIILSLLPFAAFSQSLEGGISGGVSTTSNPNKAPSFGSKLTGGVVVPALSAQALFNVNGLMQAGITADYYGLKGWYSNLKGDANRYKLANAQLNVLAELNGKTDGDKGYLYVGGALGIDNSIQFVWGAQLGYVYKPTKHVGVFAQASMRKITLYNLFTFPATIGVRVMI